MKLTTNLSTPLIELLRDRDAPIDGIEVGPWISPREILDHRNALSGYPFYFHGGSVALRTRLFSDAGDTILHYLEVTGSPWVSLHVGLHPLEMRRLCQRMGWRLPLPFPERSVRAFIRKMTELSRRVIVPMLLENSDPVPISDNYEVPAERMARILDATGSGLLLDIGHARLAAEFLRISCEEYLAGLPMERIVQVHVSGPRTSGGRMVDAHETLQEEDYRLLEFVLKRSKPDVVTLEYTRRKDALRGQLWRLRDIIGAQE